MNRRRDPTPLSEVLAGLLGRFGVADLALWERIEREWDEVAGAPWQGNSRPLSLTDRVLVVEATAPAAVALLRYGKAGLMQRLERRYGDGVVEEVKVRPPSRGVSRR